MLAAVVRGPSFEEVVNQILSCEKHVHLLELRFDLFSFFSLHEIKKLKKISSLPMIFTLRTFSQGGQFKEDFSSWKQKIETLASCTPAYVDVEDQYSETLLQDLFIKFPKVVPIISFHDFKKTPEEIESLFSSIKRNVNALYKLAFMAEKTTDSLRLLIFLKKQQEKIIGISMGKDGSVSRILSPLFGSPFMYTSFPHEQTKEGRLSFQTLKEIYQVQKYSSNTNLYGLIGHPIEKSISEYTHNAFFQAFGINAAYVKMNIKNEELLPFFSFARKLNMKGISVTMPLKEKVIPFLNEISEEAKWIGAVNTLSIKDEKIFGDNTDGKGALDAIEQKKSVYGKKMVVLGIGGAAKAIAYEGIKRGALVTMVCRDEQKGKDFQRKVPVSITSFHKIDTLSYDILINTTPLSLPVSLVIPQTLLMDINIKPKETEFLLLGQKNDCEIIYGFEMFIRQAAYQFMNWFDFSFSKEEIVPFLQEEAIKRLS